MMPKKAVLLVFIVLFVSITAVAIIFVNKPKGPEKPEKKVNILEIGRPKIWYCDRVMLIQGKLPPKNVFEKFLEPDVNLSEVGVKVSPVPVEFSCRKDVGVCEKNGRVCFEHAVMGDGWVIEWGMKDCESGVKVEHVCKPVKTCAIYFTGIGCPHCARTDPYLIYRVIPEKPVVVVEYEVYKDSVYNARAMEYYINHFVPQDRKMEHYGIPQLYFGKESIIIGDEPILESTSKMIDQSDNCRIDDVKTFIEASG